jgi:predicted MFS family arabinose efflux permease
MSVPSQAIASTIRFPLLAFAFASFGTGTMEFVIMGLLPDVARDHAHVPFPASDPVAGLQGPLVSLWHLR